ncbi:MAG: DinB family protein [Clostridia bacterium]|nr:DinB family protein [Clostridia bacterium]
MPNAREVFAHWEPVLAGLVELVEPLDEAELAWVPPGGVNSIHKLLRHLISAEEFWVEQVIRGGTMTPRTFQLLPTKAAILEDMRRVHARTLSHLDELGWEDLVRERRVVPEGSPFAGQELTLYQILSLCVDHVCHHRGQICLLLRLMGKTPPARYVAW